MITNRQTGPAPAEVLHSELLAQVAPMFAAYDSERVFQPDTAAANFNERLLHLSEQIRDQAAADPANSPAEVQGRIVECYGTIDRFNPDQPDTIDKIVNKYDVNTQRFRQVELSPYDEMALLKSVAVAGISRGTDAGAKLALRANRILTHELTNKIGRPKDASDAESTRFLNRLSRVVFARQALNEIEERQRLRSLTSIDDIMGSWDQLALAPSEQPDTFVAEVDLGDNEDERVDFMRMLDVEVNERLLGLRVIGNSLRADLGDSVKIEYYKALIFEGEETVVPSKAGGRPPRKPTETGDDTEVDDDNHERTSAFEDEYVYAVITKQNPDGSQAVDVVAECPKPDNACYVVRDDVQQAVGEMIGRPVDWKYLFSQRKNTARQLGARSFKHAQNGDVPGHVLHYLRDPVESPLKRLAQRWLTDKKHIFTPAMAPTRYNRLPKDVLRHVADRKAQAKSWLEVWLGYDSTDSAQRIDLGGVALSGTIRPAFAETAGNPETLLSPTEHELSDLRLANSNLVDRLGSVSDQLAAATQERDELARQLAIIRGVVLSASSESATTLPD